MNNIDPDIIAALRSVAGDEEARRLLNVKKRQANQAQQQFESQMELLADEVARVIPRGHQLFDLVLTLAVAHKIERTQQQEPEYIPDIAAGWPRGY